MLTLFYVIFSVIFQGSICAESPTNLINCTWQFIFNNETWNSDYSNQSTMAYLNKSSEITNSLKLSLSNILSVIAVTNLIESGSRVVATVVTGTNSTVDKETVNNALVKLGAAILENSPLSKIPCGISTSTASSITTNTRTTSSMFQSATTMPPVMSTSLSIFLNLTTLNTSSTNPSIFTTYFNGSSFYSNITTLPSTMTQSSNLITNSPNITEVGTNMTTIPRNVTSDNVTNPRIDYNMTTPSSASANSTNTYSINTVNSTMTTGNLISTNYSTISINTSSTNTVNSTMTTGNLISTNYSTISINTSSTSTISTFSQSDNTKTVTTASAERNGTTSALNVSVTTHLPNIVGTNTIQSSSVTDSRTTTKDLNGSTIATTMTSMLTFPTTGVSVPLTNYSLRFTNIMWIEQYKFPENVAYKNRVSEMRDNISTALGVIKSVVIIYSLEPGSVISTTGIPSNFTPQQVNNSLKILAAYIAVPVPQSTSTIRTTPITTSQTPTLPTYAIILISIFSTALFIAILFVITALICRHRRLKGYGRHQVQFFEMENGWKYGTNNKSYHE